MDVFGDTESRGGIFWGLRVRKKGVVDNYKHPNKEKYPDQYIYVVSLDGYIHYVPYVIDGDDIFLKNIIPSRKLNKLYGENNEIQQ